MDPYFEGWEWTPFHSEFAHAIAHQLNRKLGPRYVAVAERREVVADPEPWEMAGAIVIPDGGVRRSRRRNGALAGGAATIAAPVEVATLVSNRLPDHWVEIWQGKRRKPVTVIEILSPFNKQGRGRIEYLDKREKILDQPIHLLEIDLLRKGQRLPMRPPPPKAPYYVYLCRAGQRPRTEVWPIGFADPLPPAPVPLLAPDPDVPLELQAAMNGLYDAASFDLLIDYTAPPQTPLPPPWDKWARKCIRAAGIRS